METVHRILELRTGAGRVGNYPRMTTLRDIEEIRAQLEPKREANFAEAFIWFLVGVGVGTFIAAELFIHFHPIQ